MPPLRGVIPAMRGPIDEVREFLQAALFVPVPDQRSETATALRRRRVVTALTLMVGMPLLAWALRIRPGDWLFYAATLALALVWSIGAMASGPLHAGWGHTRRGGHAARPVVQSLALGTLVLGVFLAGALLVGRLPSLRASLVVLLDHARLGSTLTVLALTVVNGIAEELYFRGALFAALPRWPVAITTVLYGLTTVGTGIPLLVVAALVLGVVTGLQRRVTGGILGPAITHLVWSCGMLLLLPPVLNVAR